MIQKSAEAAIAGITHINAPVIGAGRTDAAPNALGQVAIFRIGGDMTPREWTRALKGTCRRASWLDRQC
jgi:tRNA U38,U39,U40 pseudouridine synthase TruA